MNPSPSDPAPVPNELRQVYETAIFDVHLPGGTVTLSLCGVRSGDPALLPPASLTVVTAYNPGTQRPSPKQNEAAQRRLAAYIRRRGWAAYPTNGADPERTHQEPSFAVLGLTPAGAVELGRRFRQAAIFYWHHNAGQLLWCEPNNGAVLVEAE